MQRVRGPRPYRDPAAPATGRGTLVVVVRPTNAPERGLGHAAVALAPDGPLTQPRAAATDTDGVARLDSVPVGPYRIRVRRIGYRPLEVPLRIEEGCPQRAEVYLEPSPNCLFECPQVPARVTLTSCEPAT